MKTSVYDIKGKKVKDIKMPIQFNTPVRKDIIRRAVVAIRKNKVQPYGHRKLAGRTSSAVFRSTRTGYGHSYNWGIARVPRLMVRGGRRVGRVMNVPHAVGGPRAHGPKAEKIWKVKMNTKERRLAIRSALAATLDKKIVSEHGHKVPEIFPLIIVEDFENLSKTKDVIDFLMALGLEAEMERASKKKVRAGKGTMRGRPYKKKKGPLFVISKVSPIIKAASNIPGIDTVVVSQINTELLAPGAHPGRLVVYSELALKKMEEEKLFF